MTVDELKDLVLSEYRKANCDRRKTLMALEKLCDESEELTLAFALYGMEIIKAFFEKQNNTLQ